MTAVTDVNGRTVIETRSGSEAILVVEPGPPGVWQNRFGMRGIWGLIAVGVAWFVTVGPAQAGGERVTLMLEGAPCVESRAAVEAALMAVDGVKAIDLRSIPGHALVDVETGILSSEQVAGAVNRLNLTDGRCAAQVMRSCISAMNAK